MKMNVLLLLCTASFSVHAGVEVSAKVYYDYDELGRVIAQRGNNGQLMTYTYDKNGNVESVTDGSDNTTIMAYDALNRVRSSTDSSGKATYFEYDVADRLSKVTDPLGNSTTYSRDGFGQLWQQVSPDGGVTSNDYSSTGLRSSMARSGSQVIGYEYDGAGRLTKVTAGGEIQSFTYDACVNGKSHVCRVADSSGEVSYAYTPYGEIAAQTSLMPSGGQASFTYTYDDVGRVTEIAYPGSIGVKYGYTAGELTSVSASIAGVIRPVATGISYRPFGAITDWAYGNGLNRKVNYDLDGRVTGISAGDASTVLQSLTYAYNVNNLVSKITNGINAGVTQEYDYDGLSRLKTLSTGYGDSFLFLYDANGNRTRVELTKAGVTTATNYDMAAGSNRLMGVSGGTSRSYTYDGSGNSTAIAGLNHSYTYDAFDHLTTATTTAGITQYAFNALGQRVYKNGPSGEYWFANDQNGSLLADYKAGIGWTAYVRMGGEIIGFVRSNQLYYVSSDHLKRPELVTNSSKVAVWRANNYAFNRSIALNQIGELNVGFPGQYYDTETGHWNNGFRDYDDDTGRYLQSDPIGLQAGTNPYAYVMSNPVNAVDPSGLIVVFDPNASQAVKDAYTDLKKTKKGKAMCTALENSSETYTVGETTRDTNYDPIFKIVSLNVKDPHRAVTQLGWMATPLAVVLGHELGHALGTLDDGPGRMNNVNQYENPLRAEFGLPFRITY
jgi:RHS repeat-associated protein